MTSLPTAPSHRLELTLRKPVLSWFAKPTVVVAGRGNPAQWGTGTWQIAAEGPTVIRIFLFNRLWRFGTAELTLDTVRPAALAYSAPRLPFLRGKLTIIS